MEPMTLDELMIYWLEKSGDIATDESLNDTDRYYQFIDAYTAYLFYRNAVNDLYEEAEREAEAWSLTKGYLNKGEL